MLSVCGPPCIARCLDGQFQSPASGNLSVNGSKTGSVYPRGKKSCCWEAVAWTSHLVLKTLGHGEHSKLAPTHQTDLSVAAERAVCWQGEPMSRDRALDYRVQG